MSWRTVCITKRSKLDLRMNYLVVRSEDQTTKIHLGEIEVLIIETTQASMTAALIAELSRQKIRLIFCDPKHNPIAEAMPYIACHDASKKIKTQFYWDGIFKEKLWQAIVYQKIFQQRALLEEMKCDSYYTDLLSKYMDEIEPDDTSNREGLAAKVYFNGLFSSDFIRGEETALNAGLNYGYQILLSCFNREIKACGYLTEIGIHHDNQHNPFNFSSDLMEPFRPLVDRLVYYHDFEIFGTEEKRTMQTLLHTTVKIHLKNQVLPHAIRIYTKSVMDALNAQDINLIKWIV